MRVLFANIIVLHDTHWEGLSESEQSDDDEKATRDLTASQNRRKTSGNKLLANLWSSMKTVRGGFGWSSIRWETPCSLCHESTFHAKRMKSLFGPKEKEMLLWYLLFNAREGSKSAMPGALFVDNRLLTNNLSLHELERLFHLLAMLEYLGYGKNNHWSTGLARRCWNRRCGSLLQSSTTGTCLRTVKDSSLLIMLLIILLSHLTPWSRAQFRWAFMVSSQTRMFAKTVCILPNPDGVRKTVPASFRSLSTTTYYINLLYGLYSRVLHYLWIWTWQEIFCWSWCI
jgi:hypothetical protein